MDFAKLRPLLGSAAAGAARVVQVGTTLALVPLLVNGLGKEHFAIWLAASSLMAATSFLDLGIGSFLVNRISRVRAGRSASIRSLDISSGLAVLLIFGGVSGALVSIFFVVFARSPAAKNLGGDIGAQAFFMTILTLCAIAPLTLVSKIRLALYEVSVHSIWDMLASILTFVAILTVIRVGGGLELAVASFCLIPALVLLANGFHLLSGHPELSPSLSSTSRRAAAALLKGGFPFFALNALSSISFSFDSVLALQLLDPAQASEFGVAQRMAAGMQTLLTLSLVPFWPSFRAALSVDRRGAALQTLAFALSVAVSLSLPASLLVLTMGSYLTDIWTAGAISMPENLSFAVAIWIPLFGMVAVTNALMNVPALVGFQLKLLCQSSVGSLVAKVVLSRYLGAAGLFWGNIGSVTLIMLIPSCLLIWRTLTKPTAP